MAKIISSKTVYKRGNPRMLDKYKLELFHKSEASWKFREMYLPPEKELGFVIKAPSPKKPKPCSSNRI